MAYQSGVRKRSAENEDRSHLDALDVTLHELRHFKPQLLLCYGLRRGLIVRCADLGIELGEMCLGWLFGGRTFDFSVLSPEN